MFLALSTRQGWYQQEGQTDQDRTTSLFSDSSLETSNGTLKGLDKSPGGAFFRQQTSRLLAILDRTRELLMDLNGLPEKKEFQLMDWSRIDCHTSKGFMNQLHPTLDHLSKVQRRIQDSQSRLLFVGDVNAGKSTLVNSLLRKRLVTEDQQPCTALFVELLDAGSNNDGLEEIHAYRGTCLSNGTVNSVLGSLLTKTDQEFTRYDISRLQELTEDPEGPYQLLKVYCHDDHATYQQSLLRNGLAEVSLIDSPGLNIDTLTTMNLFSKQQEIDVIVFVISAENHITQSGTEFLRSAQREKAHIFVVVNRFDNIRNKDKCRREILLQIEYLIPETHRDASNLVHFVSAKNYLDTYLSGPVTENAFFSPDATRNPQETIKNISDYEDMEEKLHSFVLQRRSRSKLYPAKTFLLHVLSDVKLLTFNRSKALENMRGDIQKGLKAAAPTYESMVKLKTQMFDCMDAKIEEAAKQELVYSKNCFKDILADFDFLSEGVTYGGIFSAWYYARRLRALALSLSRKKFEHCVDHARKTCYKMVETIQSDSKAVTTEQLPSIVELGLSVQSAFKDAEPLIPEIPLNIMDIFGVYEALDALYVPSMAFLAGGLLGYRSLASGLLRLTQSLGVTNTTRFLFASVSVVGAGFILYTLSDLKSMIQKKVVSKVTYELKTTSFIERQSEEIAVRTRKALRGSLWDLQTQFQIAFYEGDRCRKDLEDQEVRLQNVFDYYQDLQKKTIVLEDTLKDIDLEEE